MLGALAEARLPAMLEFPSLLLRVVTAPVYIPSPFHFDRRRWPGVPPLLCCGAIRTLVCHGLGPTLSIGQTAQTVNGRLFALFGG
jgi:hypothetical protein